MATKWKNNPLFRILAFLDITGLQPFSVVNDITIDGIFIDVKRTFSTDSVIYDIILHGLHAFCANITRLFVDAEERGKLLALVGESDEVFTPFREGLLAPASLDAFVETPESQLPLWALLRLREAFTPQAQSSQTQTQTQSSQVTPQPPQTTLPEQFLIDALDDWMGGREAAANDAMVLACGVQPGVLAAARARAEELPNAVEDFIIDVIFPPVWGVKKEKEEEEEKMGKKKRGSDGVLDWLILSYEKCNEAVNVEEDDHDDNNMVKQKEKKSFGESPAKRERKEEGEVKEEDDDEEEEYLTAENLDRFMLERPSLIPKEIIREKRRSLKDPMITEFELQNHYSASELYAFVKEDIGERRRLKKAQCIRLILDYYSNKKKENGEVSENKILATE